MDTLRPARYDFLSTFVGHTYLFRKGFHGNIVSVYLKNSYAPKGPASLKSAKYWHRKVIDDYGPLNSAHTGTIHNVATIASGALVEGFGVACMGARMSFSLASMFDTHSVCSYWKM